VEANKMAIRDFGEIAEKLRRSTVLVLPGERGNGSGVIWSADGVIVTNAHVARGSHLRVQLWDGRELEAAVVSRDTRRDLAELRVSAADLPAATAADSSQVRPGELAIAIGNPLGFVGALTTGVIHAVGPVAGPLGGPLRRLGSDPWVQADVRLAPGNSGGPLADARGRVIGINTLVAGSLALAVPSNDVTHFLAADPIDAWLGVSVAPVRVPRPGTRSKAFGLVLLEVEPESPAANASLLPGDILLGTDEKSFASLDDLSSALKGSGPRLLRLAFLRGDYERFRRVTVQLGVQRNPRSAAAA
jgi:serine protease Do